MAALLGLWAVAALAQQPRPLSPSTARQGSAVVFGDVYLVMQSGEIRLGAGRTVYLLTNDTLLDFALALVCRDAVSLQQEALRAARLLASARRGETTASTAEEFTRLIQDAARTDSSFRAYAIRVPALVAERILGSAVDSTQVRLSGRFAFSGVARGRYRLFASLAIGERFYAYWAPLTVASDSVQADLSNRVEVSDALLCRSETRSQSR